MAKRYYEVLKQVVAGDDLRAMLVAMEPYEAGQGETVFREDILVDLDWRRLAYHPVVLDRVTELIGAVPEPYYTHLTTVGPGAVAQTSNWHHDNKPAKGLAVKAAFYLTDVTCLEDGALQLVESEALEPPTDKSPIRTVTAKAGDVVLTRPDVYHRSTRNYSQRTRKTVFVSYRVKVS